MSFWQKFPDNWKIATTILAILSLGFAGGMTLNQQFRLPNRVDSNTAAIARNQELFIARTMELEQKMATQFNALEKAVDELTRELARTNCFLRDARRATANFDLQDCLAAAGRAARNER